MTGALFSCPLPEPFLQVEILDSSCETPALRFSPRTLWPRDLFIFCCTSPADALRDVSFEHG